MNKNVDDILTNDLFGMASSEMAETLSIIEKHLVSLNSKQVACLAYLKVLGGEEQEYQDIINSVIEYRGLTGNTKGLIDALEKISLINYFKGVKLNMGGGA